MWNYLYHFSCIYGVLKRFVCHNHIFAIFLTSAIEKKPKLNWVIDVLLQRHLRLHMLYNYKYNIQKHFLVRDGREYL